MFWNHGSDATCSLRRLGKVTWNWIPVLPLLLCKALTEDVGTWMRSEAGDTGEGTRPVLPQRMTICLTCRARIKYRCLGPFVDSLIRLSGGGRAGSCVFTWLHQVRLLIRLEITRREERCVVGKRPSAWSQAPVRTGMFCAALWWVWCPGGCSWELNHSLYWGEMRIMRGES